MPQNDRRYIKASEYKQDCMFKRFRARANPGLLGVIKDLQEDLQNKDEMGEPVCLIVEGKQAHGRDLCVRGICPFFSIDKRLKELEEKRR
jgi:hypothetical protein